MLNSENTITVHCLVSSVHWTVWKHFFVKMDENENDEDVYSLMDEGAGQQVLPRRVKPPPYQKGLANVGEGDAN